MIKPPPEVGSMKTLCDIARSLSIPFADDTAPTTGFVSSNGLRMHWVDWGHADKPTLVFLHGAALTAHTWDLVCLYLRHHYHCIALDQRGHGQTDGVHDFGVDVPRDDIRGAVGALGLQRFALIGMSMGGNNAIAYAGVYPDELAAAVFIDVCPTVLPAGYQDSIAHDAGIAATTSFEAAVNVADRHNPRGSKTFKRYTLGYSLEAAPEGNWRLRYEREKPSGVSLEQTAAFMARRREALWSLVPKIRCPSLVIHGADSLAQSRENLENFRSKLPNAKLIQIFGASHDVQEDQPLALAKALNDFLAGIAW